jgi:hypothetical protein
MVKQLTGGKALVMDVEFAKYHWKT